MEKQTVYIYNELAITNAAEDGDLLNIEGVACHYNRANLNGEIVNAKSFDVFFGLYNDKKLTPALNWSHNSDIIIGGIDSLVSKKDGLHMQAHLNKNVAIVRDTLLPNILAGDIKSLSTEGWAQNIRWNDDDDTYYVGDFILTAVAVVSTPADYEAEFSVRNKFANLREQKPETALKSKWYLL